MRLVRISAVLLGGMLVVSLATQPRPFFFDTLEVTESIQRFDRYRIFLLGGGMLRGLLVIPTILFASALAEHLGRHRSIWLSTGKGFMSASGILFTVSGFTAVVMGVPAEEYRLGDPDARALEVLADSLFWIQDNLMTIAYITLALAVVGFSMTLRSAHAIPRWAFISGIAMVPLSVLALFSFAMTNPPGSDSPFYFPAAAGVVVAFVIWLSAIVLSKSDTPTEPRAGPSAG